MVSSNESANPRTKGARSHPDSYDRDQGNRLSRPSATSYKENDESNQTELTKLALKRASNEGCWR